MAKVQSAFYCQNCGAQSGKWVGKCSSCGEWNTFVEEIIKKENSRESLSRKSASSPSKPVPLTQVNFSGEKRVLTGDPELDRALGGGLVPGSFVLLGGEPGIGKSTLLLQLASSIRGSKTLYVSGEESAAQIRMRAERLNSLTQDCYILNEISVQSILLHAENLKPSLLIIDSIQTLQTEGIQSMAGSVSQIKESASELYRFAKETEIPVFVIGHITKDGSIAGPKVLEHMADTVLQFEGDRHHVYRILRTIKNRFGSSHEVGLYEMTGEGMKPVSNPSEFISDNRSGNFSGTSIGVIQEGMRPMVVEVQALVSPAVYGTPQRSSLGFDIKRLALMLAVLEKRNRFRLGTQDVFVNVTGGIRVEDPALDLSIITSVISSFLNIPVPVKTCFAGEVGLSGEVRPVARIEQRIAEAEKLGFRDVFISSHNMKGLEGKKFKINIQPVSRVEDLGSILFSEQPETA